MLTIYTPPDALFAPEVQQGIQSVRRKFGKLLDELDLAMHVRPDYVVDGIALNAMIAWGGRDRYYITLDGDPVAL